MEFGSGDKATRRVIGPRQIAMFGRCWFVSDSPLRSPPCLAPLPPHSILLLAGAELSSSPSSLSPTSSLSLCFRPLYLSRSSLHARTLLGRPRTAGTGSGAAQGSGPPAAPVHTGSRFLPRGRPRCAVSHVRCAGLRSPRGTYEPATWLLCSTATMIDLHLQILLWAVFLLFRRNLPRLVPGSEQTPEQGINGTKPIAGRRCLDPCRRRGGLRARARRCASSARMWRVGVAAVEGEGALATRDFNC